MTVTASQHRKLLVVVIAVAVVSSSTLALARIYVAYQAGRYVPFVDFPSFFYAANAAFERGVSPYLPSTLAWYGEALDQRIWPFLYPPPALVIFSPLAFIDYNVAALSFFFFNVLALIYLISYLYGRYVREISLREIFVISLVALATYYPFAKTVINGQINFLVVILLLKAWEWAAEDTKPVATGLALGAAILLKTYPALLLLAFVVRWNPAVLVSCAALLVGAVLLSALVLPFEIWHQWLTEILPSGGYAKTPVGLFDPGVFANLSVNGVMSRLFESQSSARVFGYLLSGAVVAASLLVLWRNRRRSLGPYYDQSFALLLVAMFLVAPLSWFHHLVFTLPSLLFVLTRFGDAPGKMPLAGGARTAFAILVSMNFLVHFRPISEAYASVAYLPTVGLLILWGFIAYQTGSRPARQTA